MSNHRGKNSSITFSKKITQIFEMRIISCYRARVLKRDERKRRERWAGRRNARNSRNDMKYPRNRPLLLLEHRARRRLVKLIYICKVGKKEKSIARDGGSDMCCNL